MSSFWLIEDFTKEQDVRGHGILVIVANTTYMGMNAFHSTGVLGNLLVYQLLVEDVKMDVDMPTPLG